MTATLALNAQSALALKSTRLQRGHWECAPLLLSRPNRLCLALVQRIGIGVAQPPPRRDRGCPGRSVGSRLAACSLASAKPPSPPTTPIVRRVPVDFHEQHGAKHGPDQRRPGANGPQDVPVAVACPGPARTSRAACYGRHPSGNNGLQAAERGEFNWDSVPPSTAGSRPRTNLAHGRNGISPICRSRRLPGGRSLQGDRVRS